MMHSVPPPKYPQGFSQIQNVGALDGWHCAHSPESIHDPIANPDGGAEDILGIGKIMIGKKVVGFVYRMASGRFYA